MKKNNFYIALSVLILLSFANCSDSQTYGIPNLDNDCTTIAATTKIASLDVGTLNTIHNIITDDIIEGYVVSSDEGGNFYKSVSVVSIDNSIGLNIALDAIGLYTQFEPGRKIYIKLNGLDYEQATNFTNGLNLGIQYQPESGATRIGRIDNIYINKYITRSCEKIDENLLVNRLTISQAKNDKYINQLIEIDAVQFTQASLGFNYFDEALKSFASATSINHNITDSNENKLIVRVSEFANFASKPVAVGSGKIRGILTKYGNDYQFMIRTVNDVQFNQPRFEKEPVLPPTSIFFPFIGADFNTWQAFLDSFGTTTAVNKSLVIEQNGIGIDNTTAMGIQGSTTANGPLFFVRPTGTNLPINPTKLNIWIKGTAEKTISINLYKTNGAYYTFNVGTLNDAKSINVSASNSYTGTINTNNEWRLVQLKISELSDLNLTDSTKDFLSFRIGNNAAYNLLIDNITIE